MEQIRIQKIIANSGLCSRRKAEEYIEKGLVKINGKKALLGDKASLNDKIVVNGRELYQTQNNNFIYVLLNKPEKTICTHKDFKGRQTVYDLIDTKERLVSVGRLDYNTTGALLLTNDYEMVHKLTHPSFEINRTYRARIDMPLTLREFNQLNKGVMVNGKMSYQIVDQVADKSYMVSLHVGSYHHVKKIFEAINHKVINLKRVSYANLNVAKIPKGCYRTLTLKEIKDLKRIVREQEEKICLTKKD